MTAETRPRGEPPGTPGTGNAPARGRPRSAKAHKAIMDAAAELLLDPRPVGRQHGRGGGAGRGQQGHHLPLVADQGDRWPWTRCTPSGRPSQPGPRDTGTLRGDLLSLLRPWARLASSKPYGRVIARAGHRGADRPGLRRRVPAAGRRAAPGPGPGHLRRRHRARRDPAGHQDRGRRRPGLRPAVPPAAARPRTAQRPFRARRGGHGPGGDPARPVTVAGTGVKKKRGLP